MKAKRKNSKEIPPIDAFRLIDKDFNWGGVELDYYTYRECEHGADCCQDDYCRCGVIRVEGIQSVCIDSIIRYSFPSVACLLRVNDPESFRYCFERILLGRNLLSKDSWDILTRSGYYGEEIEGVKFDYSTAKEIDDKVRALFNMSVSQRIEYILTHEYDFIPAHLTGKIWKVETVDIDKVRAAEPWRKSRLNYSEQKGLVLQNDIPQGICQKIRTNYRIIDGHHRIAKAKKDGAKSIKIYCCD